MVLGENASVFNSAAVWSFCNRLTSGMQCQKETRKKQRKKPQNKLWLCRWMKAIANKPGGRGLRIEVMVFWLLGCKVNRNIIENEIWPSAISKPQKLQFCVTSRCYYEAL